MAVEPTQSTGARPTVYDRAHRATVHRGVDLGVRLAAVWLLGFVFSMVAWLEAPENDQMMFMYYAAEINAGGALYVDFWDNKQPGIFWVYSLLHSVFGPGWSNVRIGYSIWMSTAATLAAGAFIAARPDSRAWLAAPILTLGITMLRYHPQNVGQVEELVVLPLAALLLLCVTADREGWPSIGRWLLIGAMVAAVAWLKLVLAPVAAGIIASTLILRVASRQSTMLASAAAIAWSVAGFVAATIPVFVHFDFRGSMPVFLWTTFTYPGLAMTFLDAADPNRLLRSLGWLFKASGPLLPAAAVGAWSLRRTRGSRGAVLAAGCLAWLVVSFVMIVMQKFSWWQYHMVLLVWPIGLLAVLGIAAGDWTTGRRGQSPLVLAVTVLAVGGVLLHTANLLRKAAWSVDWPISQVERQIRETAVEVAASSPVLCGTVYAIGGTGLQVATGRRQAIPTHGIFLGAFLPSQTLRLPSDLEAAMPDLVHVNVYQRDFLKSKYPMVWAHLETWLQTRYVVKATDAYDGTWWARRSDALPLDCPAPTQFEIPASATRP